MTHEPPDLPPAPDARLPIATPPIATPPAPPPAGAQPAAAAPHAQAPRHGLGLWLLLLAWVVLLALGWVGWHHGVLWTRSDDEPEPEATLEAPPGGHGPTLVGQPKPRATVPHGPVRVQVVDRAGQPLAGVRVCLGSGSQPVEDVEDAPPALTDAGGCFTFADLPHDGSYEALAVGRRWLEWEDTPACWGRDTLAVRAQLGEFVVAVDADGRAVAGDGAPGLPAGSALPLESLLGFAQAAEPLADLHWMLDEQRHVLARASVRGPELRLEVDVGLPLEVEVLDDRGGRPVEGARWECAPRLGWEAPAEARPQAGRTVLAAPGAGVGLDLEVEAPPGWRPDEVAPMDTWLHPATRSLRAVAVVRPALEVVLAFPAGMPTPRLEEWDGPVWLGEDAVELTSASVDAEGRLHLHGARFVPGELLSTAWWKNGREGLLEGEVVLGHEPVTSVVIQLHRKPPQAPREEEMPWGEAVGDDEEAGTREALPSQGPVQPGLEPEQQPEPEAEHEPDLWIGRDGDPESQAREWIACQQRLAGPRGPLPLRLRLPGGAAAARALVRAEGGAAPRGRVAWQQADAAGSVTLPDVPCGPLRVLVLGGGAPALVEVEAGALPRGEQVVSLPAGATLRVQVRAPSGQPLPFATLEVEHASGLPWVDIADGVQRLDALTDVRGERRLHDLPPGKLTLTARLGTRAAEVQMDLREGSTQQVQLTLPDARPQDAAEEVEAQEVLPLPPR